MPHITLVDTSVLAAHIDDPDWVVVDCRHDLLNPHAAAAEYSIDHIPGAFFASLEGDLAGQSNGRNGRHPLPDPKSLAGKLSSFGLAPGRQLIAYDAQGGMFAARLWWLARWLGHSSVAVLDGGWQRWIAEDRPRSNAIPPDRTSGFSGTPDSNWVGADFVLTHLRDIVLLDARAPDRFRGENETLDPVGGRIPGARNRFFRDNLDAGGRFKLADKLLEEYKAVLAGMPIDKVVHSCGSGVSACHNLLAMEIAGMPGSRLYPGSWSEWCSDPGRPIARGNPQANTD